MKDKILWIGVLLIIIAFVGLIIWQKNKPGEYDVLAQCLTDKGVKEYGAYWCPHCQKQKKDFGNSFRKITYIECGLPGGAKGGQTLECDEAGYFLMDRDLKAHRRFKDLRKNQGVRLSNAYDYENEIGYSRFGSARHAHIRIFYLLPLRRCNGHLL